MELAAHHTLDQSIAGALLWWRQAGVDCAFGDEPIAWLESLAETEAVMPSEPASPSLGTAAPPATPELPKIGGEKDLWPQDLAAFDAWWMHEPSLDFGTTTKRVSARGSANPELLILVEQPEAADTETLLSGEQGMMLSIILRAMGIAPEMVRIASVLVRHVPMVDWPSLHAGGMAELLAHHVHLTAPRRIMSFGSNIPPLLGNDPAQTAQTLRSFNQDGSTIPVLAERSLDALMRPKAKSVFWQRWLDWTGV